MTALQLALSGMAVRSWVCPVVSVKSTWAVTTPLLSGHSWLVTCLVGTVLLTMAQQLVLVTL
jgi:hypothetical protein